MVKKELVSTHGLHLTSPVSGGVLEEVLREQLSADCTLTQESSDAGWAFVPL